MNTSKADAKKNAPKTNDLPQEAGDLDFIEPLTPEETEQLKAPLPETVSAGGLTVSKLTDSEFIDSVFDELDKAGEEKELTSNYLDFKEFNKGETRSFIATGMTTFTTQEGELKPAVKLMNRERQNFICGSTIVVNTIKRLENLPAPVKIQVNGMVKGKNGSYYDVKIFTL